MITCVIYDCDGVLFDSLEANRRLYNHICLAMDRPPITEEELAYCHMHTVYESLARLFPGDAETEARASEFLKSKVDLRDFIQYLKIEPHLFETLSALREKRVRTAISTNRTTSMKHIMEKFSLWPFFDMVVTALDVVRPKPDKESVEKIIAALKVRPQDSLYVGDSEIDLKTAESAGVTFVAYKNPKISKGLLIQDHLDLLPLVA